jgi:predicted permease
VIELLVDIAWTVILPIFLIIGLGASLGRILKVDPYGLNKLNLYVFVPALVFTKFLYADLNLGQIGMVSFFWLCQALVMWALAAFACAALKVARARRHIVTMGFMFPNSGNYGIPVAELAFGAWGVAVQSVVLAAQNIVFFTLGTFLAGGGMARFRAGLKAALRIPVIHAIVLAFFLRAKPELVPVPLDKAIGMLSAGLIPIALLTLGAQLGAGAPPRPTRDVNLIVLGRLLLGPLVGFLIVTLLGMEPALARVLIVSASFPLAVNTALLAIEFKRQPALAAAGVLWTTILSSLTVTCTIALVGR